MSDTSDTSTSSSSCTRSLFKYAPGHHFKAQRYNFGSCCLLSTAVVGTLIATVAHDQLSNYVSGQLRNQFVLDSPQAGSYAGFQDSRDPNSGTVYSNYWMYNITNPEEIVMNGAKPILVEIGPLRYVYTNIKYNISWEEDGDIVNYKEYQYYTPADNATAILQDQVITTINVLLLAAINPNSGEADDIPFLFPSTKEPLALFTQKTIKEMLFGYTDDVLPAKFPGLQPNDTSLDYALAQHSPIRAYTGKWSPDKAWEYVEWDGMDSLQCCKNGPQGEAGSEASGSCVPAWNDWDSSQIRGSFGSNYHMGIRADETLYIGTYDFGILRHWPLQCENVGSGPGPGWFDDASDLTANMGGCDTYTVQGIDVLRFGLPQWVLGNESVSADEAVGYGIHGPSGVLNSTLCETYAPIFLSRPHFLYGSNSLLDAVEGIPPGDPAIHDSWVGIEPVTGQTFNFQFRIGINALAQPTSTFPFGVEFVYFPTLNATYFPLGWGEQISGVTPSQADEFKSQVYLGLRVLAGLRWGGIVLGAVAFIGAILCRYYATREHTKMRAGLGEELLGREFNGEDENDDDEGDTNHQKTKKNKRNGDGGGKKNNMGRQQAPGSDVLLYAFDGAGGNGNGGNKSSSRLGNVSYSNMLN